MKKIFSFALVAVMVASMFSFVACKGKNQSEPEAPMETPTVLTGTTWVNGAGTTWVTTLKFVTETSGVRMVENPNPSESDITYEYANGKGSFTITNSDETFQFTVEGNKLSVPNPDDPDPAFTEVYTLVLK